MAASMVNLVYLLAAALFILGLKGLSHPRTAVRGNLLGALGMLLAVVVTLLNRGIVGFETILAGAVMGAVVGTIIATRFSTTAVPQLVALFNGFGGGASALVAVVALEQIGDSESLPPIQVLVAAETSVLIGALTFWGSMVASAKLQGLVSERPLLLPAQRILSGILLLICLAWAVWMGLEPQSTSSLWILVALASVLGVMLVIPVGGADMPVVISLLNSCSGLAAAATGFALDNNVLIVGGSLVGAAGFILTVHMSRAMNRSLINVLSGKVGKTALVPGQAEATYEGKIKSTTPEEVAILLEDAHRVILVPGFGMAIAQAQYATRDLANLLQSRGAEVEFAIHPVAGRMPGHMNVLLAEADIPYDQLKEMDEINPTFQQTDVVMVIGANDVVNPLAREDDPSIPIAGLPILNVDQARVIVVIKRSLSPGFAGIPNPLFAADNTLMLFGDAKEMTLAVAAALKLSVKSTVQVGR